MKKLLLNICIAVCVIAVLGSGVYIFSVLLSRNENKEYYDSLQDEYTVFSDTSSEEAEQTVSNNTTSEKTNIRNNINGDTTVNFAALLQQNDDVIGWIYCPNTKINYPIVKGEDNVYYLNHMLSGKKNAAGTIFADYQNKSDFSDYNTVIYGHHMNNKSMFGSLVNYKKQSYYEKHPKMYLFTPNGDYNLILICGFVTDDTSNIYLVPANAELCRELVNEGIEKSTFNSSVSVEDTDKIVTLSTCSYETKTSRYVIMCKLEKID